MYLYPFSEILLVLRKVVCRELQIQERSLIRLPNVEEHQYAGISVIITISSSRTPTTTLRSSL
jgi:hypothetical protein